jgi:hypothetical protein
VRHNAALSIGRIAGAAPLGRVPASTVATLELAAATPATVVEPPFDGNTAASLAAFEAAEAGRRAAAAEEHWVVVGNAKLALQAIALRQRSAPPMPRL